MLNYANRLYEGIYSEDKKLDSEKYYLMAIEHKHIGAMLKYADHLSDGFYGKDKRITSEKYYWMAIGNKDFEPIYQQAISISKELSQVSNSNLSEQTELIKNKYQLGIILSLILLTDFFPEFDGINFDVNYWLEFNEIQLQAIINYANALYTGVYGSVKIPMSELFYLMAIEHGHVSSMNNYAFALSEGVYVSDKIHLSDQYFLIAINH
jgi:TPR repeat protein